MQNYCFKRLCSDNDEFVRLHEYTKSICDRAPVRKNVRPYRPKVSKSFGTPSEKIDIDADDEIDDYYVEVGAESVNIELFASDNNTMYRSLLESEKEMLFDKLSNVFDVETLSIDEDFTDHTETNDEEDERDLTDETLEKRSQISVGSKEISKAAEAMRLYKDDFSFEILEDVFSVYLDKADDFFGIFKDFLGEEKFNIFYNAFQEARERVSLKAEDALTMPSSNKLCLVEPFIGTLFNLEDSQVMLEASGCTVSVLVDTANAGYCPTIAHCACQCALGIGIKKCLERYADVEEYRYLIEESNEFLTMSCDSSAANGAPEQIDADSIVVKAEAERLEKLHMEEKLDHQFSFLKNLKTVAKSLDFDNELEEFRTELILKSSIARPVSEEVNTLSAQVVLDKCELKNSDLKDYMKFNLDSCDIRDLYYCKNHYKGNKCLQFEKDKNECNSACCLEIKMAECAKSHCLSKKPVKEFEKIANLICTEYADPHVTNGAPFPDADEDSTSDSTDQEQPENVSEEEDDENDCDESEKEDNGMLLEERSLSEDEELDYDDDVLNNVGESVCELEEFEPGYDTTKCDKEEVKGCIKDGIQFLLDDPEHFCPYCVNDNAYDDCRCACCFGKYFSKVCYDPHCGILTEKLRYKRYVREVCKTRPVKYLFSRDLKEPFKFKKLSSTEKKVEDKSAIVDEYNDLEKKKKLSKSHPKTDKGNQKNTNDDSAEFDLFSGFNEGPNRTEQGESDVYFESRPVNIHKESLEEKKKSKLRYNFKLQGHKKRETEYTSDEYDDLDQDDTHILYVQDEASGSKLARRDAKSKNPTVKIKSMTRAQSFAKGGGMTSKGKKKDVNKGPEHIKAQTKLTTSAKAFGLDPEKQLKKKKPNKPKKTKGGSDKYLVDGPKFIGKFPKDEDKGMPSRSRVVKTPVIDDSARDFERDQTIYDDDHTLPFDAINEGVEEEEFQNQEGEVNDEYDEFSESDSSYKNKTPFNLGKPNSPGRRKPSSKVPKLNRRMDVFQRDILYKRSFDANAIEDDIVENGTKFDGANVSNISTTPKLRTITRTIKHTKESNSPTSMTSTEKEEDVFGMMVIGGKTTDESDVSTLTTTVSSGFTSYITQTSYLTITSVLPRETTITKTIRDHSSSISSNSSTPATVTYIKTRFRPTTLTETEYEDFSTETTTEYDDTLTVTIPKKTITRHKGTTTDTDTLEVTSTFTTSKTKTIPNITITEFEESDQTVTSILTKSVTLTETQYEDIITKTVTTYSGVTSETVAKKTITVYKDSTEITETETETEYETKFKTKWYPEETVTEYEDEETITEIKYYPTTTTDSTTITTTTTATTTLTSTLAGRARPQPNVNIVAPLLPRNYENEDGNVTEPINSNVTNKTGNKSSMADQLRPGKEFTSDGSKPNLSVFLVVSGVITIGAIALSLYTYSLVVEDDEDDINEEQQALDSESHETDKGDMFHEVEVQG